MRKSSFKKSHQEFEKWLDLYEAYMEELAQITAAKFAKRPIKTEIIEALVLRVAVRWERVVEEDIITSLNRDSSAYAAALGLRLRKHLSRDECIAMLIGTRYLDFKSVSDIKSFGTRYLTIKYNPFSGITTAAQNRIDQFFKIRNLLAHYSSFAFRSYRRMMKQDFKFTRIPEPGAFLLSKSPPGGPHRWHEFFQAFRLASSNMLAAV